MGLGKGTLWITLCKGRAGQRTLMWRIPLLGRQEADAPALDPDSGLSAFVETPVGSENMARSWELVLAFTSVSFLQLVSHHRLLLFKSDLS